jgi:thrombospondin type 3 repeat protein
MPQHTRSRVRLAATTVSIWGLVLLASARPAAAQNVAPRDTSIDTQLFQPAIGPENYVTVEGAQVPEHKRLSFGLFFNYQQNPYVVFAQGSQATATNVVHNQLTGELDASMGLFGRYQIGIGLPFTPWLTGDVVDAMGAPAHLRLTESGIGDIRLEGKAHLATRGPDDQYDVALTAGITLPTGHTGDRAYLGDKTVTGRIKAIATAELGPVHGAANLGILIRETSESFATELGSEILYGVAADAPIDRKTDVVLELYGRTGLNQFAAFYGDVNPFEIDVAAKRSVAGMWSITAGGGRGLGNGLGAPDLRLFLGANFNPDFRDRDHDGVYDVNDKCPDEPEDRDGFQDADGCPDPDNDNDGIPDVRDKCPNEPEDFDEFQDEDGCPDPDNDQDGIPDLNDACPNAPEDHKGKFPNDGCPSSMEDRDGDGIPDAVDKCPDEPEDKDGFQDEDGCPDPDNDADGIPDAFDNCPNEPEDADGFEDEDGCPDPDNDKDGIPDAIDKCPMQPETLNGIKDDDGCPDPGPEVVRLVEGQKIEVDEKIGFVARAGKLAVRDSSAKYVNDVALVMKGHPDIAKLRIEVTADGVPKSETQKRAETIRDFLVTKGVDAGRLDPVGLGAGGTRVDFAISAMGAPKAAPAPAPRPSAPAPTMRTGPPLPPASVPPPATPVPGRL